MPWGRKCLDLSSARHSFIHSGRKNYCISIGCYVLISVCRGFEHVSIPLTLFTAASWVLESYPISKISFLCPSTSSVPQVCTVLCSLREGKLADIRIIEPTTQTLSTSVDILQGLLSSIPKFWSKAELTQVLNAYFESSSSVARNHTPQMSALIKVVAKKAPAKVLVPLMCEMWSDTAAGDDNVSLS